MQRACTSGRVAASASRISRSSALRLAGFASVSRTTPAAGSSTSREPTSLEDDERVPLRDGLALFDQDLLHGALVLGLHGHLHLHRLEDRDRVALFHAVADGDLDLPHGARDVSLDVRHGGKITTGGRRPREPPRSTTGPVGPSPLRTRRRWGAPVPRGTMLGVGRRVPLLPRRSAHRRKGRGGPGSWTPGPSPPPRGDAAPPEPAGAREAQGVGLQGPAPRRWGPQGSRSTGPRPPPSFPPASTSAPGPAGRTSSTSSCGC